MRHYVDIVITSSGAAVVAATVTVRVANAVPGTGALATIYSDDGITVTANPVATDSTGTFGFYVADGRYDLTVASGVGTKILADIEIADISQQSAGDVTANFNNVSIAGTLTTTGALTAGSGAISGTLSTGVSTLTEVKVPLVNKVITVDGVTYTGPQALQSAIQACGASVACVVDARNPLIGTQTFLVNPFSGLNMPITLWTGPYTIQWDPTAITVDLPPNAHWSMYGTTALNTNPNGAGILQDPLLQFRTFVGTRIYRTTCTVTSGQNTITLGSTTGVQVHSLIGCWGAAGANTNQQTTLNGAINNSVTTVPVNSTTGWDLTRPSDQFVVQIDTEYLLCTGGVANTSFACARGAFGTTAASHLNAAPVSFVPLFLAQVTSLAGNVATVDANATATVTNAIAWVGSDNVQIDGQGTIDCAQPQNTSDQNMAGVLFPQSTTSLIGSGILIRRCEHAANTIYAGRFNKVYASSELCGKPPLALGTDFWLFGAATNNLIAPASMRLGDNAMSANDRTSNSDPWSGPTNNNTFYAPSVSPYSIGLTIQCAGCSGNVFFAPFVNATNTNGKGVLVNNSGFWTTNPAPTNNTMYLGSVSGASVGIQSSGYSGGNNFFYVGSVTGGAGSIATGDWIFGTSANISRVNAMNMFRSAGGNFPDITGNGSASLVLGDSHGVRDYSYFDFAEGTTPADGTAANMERCYGDSTAHALKCSYNAGSFFNMTQTIGSGTSTTNGTAINTLTCQAQPTITVTGATVTDTATCALNAALPATWQTGIVLAPPVVTANTVTYSLCNPTATATITPAATAVRCTVTR